MNVFQNLVEELKEENLLEETVIETNPQESETEKPKDEDVQEVFQTNAEENFAGLERNEMEQENASFFDESLDAQQPIEPTENVEADSSMSEEEEFSPIYEQPIAVAAPGNKADFYRKRAMDEVSGLQMVEHVLSGVEREQMKVLPKNYDDLEVKKVLHRFMQVSENLDSPEHAQIEFQLMQETESWYSALSHRDKHVSVAHLRRYCETTRPVLSAQALISLARFYRNSPYSEAVRSKFDLILTRIFSKDLGNEKRKLAFKREELIEHLTSLYADWASIPLYAANEDDDSEILITTLKFEDFMAEADRADSFDELIKNDFFNRLRVFKKETNENFFAPLVTATAIECNVRVGNRYVDLLRLEKEKVQENILEDKYGFLHDQAISEATGKTLQLVELLKEREEKIIIEPIIKEEKQKQQKQQSRAETKAPEEKPAVVSPEKVKSKEKANPFGVNKWLLAATILSVVLSVGLYFWSNSQDIAPPSSAKIVNLENSFLKDYLKGAKINNETFVGFVHPSWNNLGKQKKEDVIKRIYEIGREQGYTKVHLFNDQGQTAGFATGQKLEAF